LVGALKRRTSWLLLLDLGCLADPIATRAPAEVAVIRSGHVPAGSLFRLLHVPIEIPAGTAEIRIQENYNHTGGNVLSVGIYGPKGYRPGTTTGFRSWSGRAKTALFLNAQAAATGYAPGPLRPGTCCSTPPPSPWRASTGS